MASKLQEKYDLNLRVDRFIEDYAERIKGKYTDIGEYIIPGRLREYIEAKAVYAELRHPIISRSANEKWARDENAKAKELFKWEVFDLVNKVSFPFVRDKEINTMALYRVIERGKFGINIDRAIEFAQERGLYVGIPIRYGAYQHLSTDKLLSFIPPLTFSTVCPKFYFNKAFDDLRNVGEATIREILEERKPYDALARESVAVL